MVSPEDHAAAHRAAGPLVFVLCPGTEPDAALLAALEREGIGYVLAEDTRSDAAPSAIVYDLTQADRRLVEQALDNPTGRRIPTMAILAPELLSAPQLKVSTDDVVVFPWRPGELTLRLQRLLDAATPQPAPGVIVAGDLVIDTNRYDVFLAGRSVLLTFKEYELLKLLASNPGRVYGREALLEQVWGYAYFGGTRTVDVHVRRLRSKIEDAQHTFIDTVWNVGYRFSG